MNLTRFIRAYWLRAFKVLLALTALRHGYDAYWLFSHGLTGSGFLSLLWAMFLAVCLWVILLIQDERQARAFGGGV